MVSPSVLSPAGGMSGLLLDTDLEVEAQVLASPLSKRLGFSPKGQMVVGLEDSVPAWPLEAAVVDVSKLEDEYRRYKQENSNEDLGSA